MAIKLAELRKLYGDNIVAIKDAVNRLVENVASLKDTSVTRENLLDPDFLVEVGLMEEPTSPDTTPPTNPTNLVATKYENRNRLEWTNSTSSDTRVTYVFRATTEGGALTQIGQVSYPTNYYEDFNVQPKQSYWYYIQCSDEVPNYSEIIPAVDGGNVVLGTTIPAPTEVLIVGSSWNQDDLNVYWDPVDEFGVSGYRVAVLSGASTRRTETVVEPKYTYSFAKNTEDGTAESTVTIRVWSLDEDGDPSPAYSEETFTHDLPAAITDLTVTRDTNDLGFRLTWTLSHDPGVIGYDMSVNSTTIESNYAGNEYLYKTNPVAGSYMFGVRAVNKFLQRSNINTYSIVVVGPGAPTGLNIKVLDNFANIFWTAPVIPAGGLPILEYTVYKQDLSGVYVEEIGTTASTYTSDLEYIPGSYRYFVQTVDIAGNVSGLASATCTIESPNFQLLVDVWENFNDATLTNLFQRDDGVLIGPINTTETFGQHFTSNGNTTMQDFVDDGCVYFLEPTPLTAEYSYELDYGTVVNQATNIVSTTDYDDHGATVEHYVASKELAWDSYTNEVNDTALNTSGFQFARTRSELISDGSQFGYINTRRLQLSSKKRSESHPFSVTVAGTPDTVTFDTPFISIVSVSASLKYASGTTGRSVEWDDGSGTPKSSIDMYVFEGGIAATGEGTVTVDGY
jgi:hypothetical protein